MAYIKARSVSGQVLEWLDGRQYNGTVLAAHTRACNLVTDQGAVITLVSPEIGNGPLNVVLEAWPDSLHTVQVGMRAVCGHKRFVLNSLAIGLGAASAWEPCPDWDVLRAQRAEVDAALELPARLCLAHDPGNVLLVLLGAPFQARRRFGMLGERFHAGAGELAAGWRGDERALTRGAAALAGLGDGLTPAGDDLLAGAMLWAWLAHPTPERFCRALAEAAVPRTTTLSAAFLRAAARGQCSAAWHGLLASLAEGKASGVAEAAEKVLACGASSGLDALIGFLYLAQIDKEDAWQTRL